MSPRLKEKRPCLHRAVKKKPAKAMDLRRPKDTKRMSSGCLTKLHKTYKGLEDIHLPLFKEVQKIAKAKCVLYPGSHWHLQASLVFPNVTYIDYNKAVAPFFQDAAVQNWISENKNYGGSAKMQFYHTDLDHLKLSGGYDLLISMSAGIVSKPCARFLRIGGHFLVSDAHFDARTVALDKRFSLVGVYDMTREKLVTSKDQLNLCFMTTTGQKISAEQVEISKKKPKGSRGFKLKREDWFYLFRRIS
ncbi:Uncharacterized protein (Fragment) [Durusdinium trenchii]|uniref:Uncharacterized protein n=1 Tax=Durusdinium trenchii TaxID=1381693 RepID=A0ABP0Q7T0_9DINO